MCTSAASSEKPTEPGSAAAAGAPLTADEKDGAPAPPAASEHLTDGRTERSSDGREASVERRVGSFEASMYDVFFCYNNKDREIVVEIAENLRGICLAGN